MKQIFIDGSAGTTGLNLQQRLQQRKDVTLIPLEEAHRKDPKARKQAIEQADVIVLCLPDEAAKEAVELAKGCKAVILDASTAHRTAPGWVYGLPELSGQHWQKVQNAQRIAVPGCHASGFIALVQPLRAAGLLPADAILHCHSITGYSGGGKAMIAQYEQGRQDALLAAPRQYALGQIHKHLPEMQTVCQLEQPPVFSPVVGNFYSRMEVTVQLHRSQLAKGAGLQEIAAVYRQLYQGPVVRYLPQAQEQGFCSAAALSGRDDMELTVHGCQDRILLVARYDNLGKGACGAALECINLVLGTQHTTERVFWQAVCIAAFAKTKAKRI